MLKVNYRIKNFILLLFITLIFMFFSLISLIKFPTVFGDEVEIINMAYHIIDKEAFSTTVFSGQLPPPGPYFEISYPPLYFWILAISLKIFGFSIYTLRLTSFFIGVLTLVILFFVLRKILESDRLALLSVFLLAVDYSFIRASHFGQVHILVTLFFALALLFYIKTFQKPNSKNFFLSGLFLGLSLFSHFIVGFIGSFLTTVHYLITKRYKRLGLKKLFLLIFNPVFFSILWLFFVIIPLFFHNPEVIKKIVSHLLYNKSTQEWSHLVYVLKGFTLHVAYEQTIFYIYLIMGLFFLFASKDKSGIRSFMILTYVFIYPYIIAMHSIFYAVFFSLVACFAFSFLLRENIKEKNIVLILFIVVIICNITSQARIIRKHHRHSYSKYSQQIADNLPLNSNVLLHKLDPEPYFYLAQNRHDLRIERGQFMDIDNNRLKSSLIKADFIVTEEKIYNIYKKIYQQNNYSSYENLDVRDKLLVDYLLRHVKKFILLNAIDVIIFKVN